MQDDLLRSAEFWFLENTRYQTETLEVRIAEGILSEPHEIEVLGVNAGQGHSVEVQPFSRRLSIRFRGVVAYQLYDETFGRPDKFEPDTKGVLREYSKSEYLEYLRSGTLFPWVRTGRFRHFGLSLGDAILDVVAEGDPEISELSESMLEADA